MTRWQESDLFVGKHYSYFSTSQKNKYILLLSHDKQEFTNLTASFISDSILPANGDKPVKQLLWRLQPQLTLKIAWSICRMYLFWSKCLLFVLFVAYVTSAVLRVRWFYQVNTLSEPGEKWSPPPSLLSASLCSEGSRLKRPKKVNTFITKIRFDPLVEE